jgi:hypothetical protein
MINQSLVQISPDVQYSTCYGKSIFEPHGGPDRSGLAQTTIATSVDAPPPSFIYLIRQTSRLIASFTANVD